MPDSEHAYVLEVTAEARVTTDGGYQAAMDAAMEMLPAESPDFTVTSVSIKRRDGDELWA